MEEENGDVLPGGRRPAGLRVYNTLTKRKDRLETSDEVTWYICGPTVYDTSHVGHARTYLTFDIIRRILEDYFGYSVFYVMNITDVDDKIIFRARRNYLLQEYRNRASDPAQVIPQLEQAFAAELAQQAKTVAETEDDIRASGSSRQREELEERKKQEALKLTKLEQAHEAFQQRKAEALSLGGREGVEHLLVGGAADVVASQLDKAGGADVRDLAIYRSHAAKYEKEFFEDMAALGIRDPDVTTRVTEYIPEIIAYIEQIQKRGFAYVSKGSVYFDTTSFQGAGHSYGKLNPGAVGNARLASESEQDFETKEKRNQCDFALWKASKAGEPSWDSPWGPGRPGWHIECSAMASDVIGSKIDIHSGGLDLQFPHHTNEIAQAEAYYDSHEWVKYFLHSGHLSIDGLKMAKSLKNFITIREALSKYTARQLRLMFVIQAWDKPMNYSEAILNDVLSRERTLKAFFATVAAVLKQSAGLDAAGKWGEEDRDLHRSYRQVTEQVHEHLEDNFDTSGALIAVFTLISATHSYLDKVEKRAKRPILLKVAKFVTRILGIFGLTDVRGEEIGFGRTRSGEILLAPYIDAFSAFREQIRSAARANNSREAILEITSSPLRGDDGQTLQAIDDPEVSRHLDAFARFREDVAAAAVAAEDGVLKERVLEITGRVRDDTLVELGIRLQDTSWGPIWFFDDVNVLQAERAEKLQVKSRNLRERRDKLRKELEKWQGASMDPQDLFKDYKQVDKDGLPTHDASGKELSKQARKKFEKDRKNFRDLQKKFKERVAAEPDFLSKIEEEISRLEHVLADLGVV